ncbi:MAG TPA: acyl-CoA dehydrogenase family protein [Acidimicrobiales bacterium]|nr:acyl-CoA dehydrogenase family protein [Acidimicrobiales bacterium]
MTALIPADLDGATAVVALAGAVVNGAAGRLAGAGDIDDEQILAYDLAHAAAAVGTASSALGYGRTGTDEGHIACAFVADVLADLTSRLVGREEAWGTTRDWWEPAAPFLSAYRSPAYLSALCGTEGDRRLDADFTLVRESFHRFAEEQLRPRAEHIHRANADIPEEVIAGLAEMGALGLSIPEEYGGFAGGGESDYLGMVVATEELAWGSLGAGGSLITRPEILARALVAGGTEEQKQRWLPELASGAVMNAVAVTEPDFGSDVANIVTSATATDGGWLINGVKTWCTFAARADVIMLLARTDPDRSKAHRGLSLFILEKPRGDGHGFTFTQDAGTQDAGTQDAGSQGRSDAPGRMEGRPIDTLGYRGMHSYEIAFENWFVPADHLVGGEAGVGRGFYLQMAGFENGRLQTAARALGVMQAAYEAAYEYATNRVVFGRPILDYQLTRAKLTRMAVLIQCTRQFSYDVARLMSRGEGTLEASMLKAYVCRAAEWVTREALQIHGGMGYAEEFSVSRYFVDARVLSIFEGADETLALKVVARRLVEQAG